MQYVSSTEWLFSPYGSDFSVGPDNLFQNTAQVDTFLNYISELIDLYAGKTFGPITATDYVRGQGQRQIYLNRFPCGSINSISFQLFGLTSAPYDFVYTYTFTAATSGVLNTNTYILYPDGRVLFSVPLYMDGMYTINYNCGYVTTPDPIKHATMMLANTIAQGIDNGAVAIPDGGALTQFRFNKFQEMYVDPKHRTIPPNVGIPTTVMAILNRYRTLSY